MTSTELAVALRDNPKQGATIPEWRQLDAASQATLLDLDPREYPPTGFNQQQGPRNPERRRQPKAAWCRETADVPTRCWISRENTQWRGDCYGRSG
jgi:hypothetical protein